MAARTRPRLYVPSSRWGRVTDKIQWGTGYTLDNGNVQVMPESSERAARQFIEKEQRSPLEGLILPELFTRTVTYGPWVKVGDDAE